MTPSGCSKIGSLMEKDTEWKEHTAHRKDGVIDPSVLAFVCAQDLIQQCCMNIRHNLEEAPTLRAPFQKTFPPFVNVLNYKI
jgi:hypothetical protein